MKPHRRTIPKIEFTFLLGLALLSAACGRQIEPEFEPYLQDFLDLSSRSGVIYQNANVEIIFGEIANAGICNKLRQKIVISRNYWNAVIYDTGRRMVLYHELGHCLGRLDHVADAEPSIMNPSVYASTRGYDADPSFFESDLMNRIKGNRSNE